MWVPSLIAANNGPIPTGIIFSCFMLAMTIGGVVFSLFLSRYNDATETMCVFVYVISAATMLIPAYNFDFWPVFICFLVLEAMLGMFNSCGAQLRSRYYPDNLQSSIMSVFRVPLNILVVIGTKLSEQANDTPSLQNVFIIVAAMHIVACALHFIVWTGYFSDDSRKNSNVKASTDAGKKKSKKLD
jgi:MFS family permease